MKHGFRSSTAVDLDSRPGGTTDARASAALTFNIAQDSTHDRTHH